MAATFELEVATPSRLLIRAQATEAQIPAKGGYIGVLPEHAPLISELGTGTLTYSADGVQSNVLIAGGWVEVLPHHTRVLAATAEMPAEIDVKRAEQSLERAENRLRDMGSEWDIPRALAAAARARARLQAARSGR